MQFDMACIVRRLASDDPCAGVCMSHCPPVPVYPSAGVAKVVKLGKGVTSLKEGQRVVGIPWTGLYGTWQQYRAMPAESLVSWLLFC